VTLSEVKPPTCASEEDALWRAFKQDGSREAREALFSLHVAFARRIAARHHRDRGGDVEFQDLFQLACAGLLEALDRFQPDHGAPFTAFARRRVSGAVLDGIGKLSEAREQLSYRRRMRAERARSLASSVPADALSASDALAALIEMAVGLAVGIMLDDPALYASGETDRRPDAYESLAWKQAVARLHAEVAGLPDREGAVLRLHYLEGVGFDEIGATLGVSKGRVSQIHKAALGSIRKRLRNPADFRLKR